MTRPALVLGSTQPDADVDLDRARQAGVDVVRRRSGGGAVLVVPDHVVWVEVAVPAGDPLWEDDVGRASWWLGDVWAEALSSLGFGRPEVHRGSPVTTPWSRTICFAGLGPGEATVDGGKVLGLSQRRTRAGAVFHCAVPLRLDGPVLVELLAFDSRRRGQALAALEAGATSLAGLGRGARRYPARTGIGVAPVSVGAVEQALADHLP